jgi:hypothetical protein
MITISKTEEEKIKELWHLPKISVGEDIYIFFETIQEFNEYLNSLNNELDSE